MAVVVHDSLHYLTEADLLAVAVYLKEGPDRKAPVQVSVATKATLQRGHALFLDNCAQCHQDDGRGIPGVIPNLAGNAVVSEFSPHDMIVVMLKGLTGTGGYGTMPGFAGALGDNQIADIANYVRVGWGNRGVPDVTPELTANLRSIAGVGPAGTESARSFDCPAVGAAPVPGVLANPLEVEALAAGGDFDMSNKIGSLIYQIRRQQPGISDAALTNIMMASFCPVVANDAALDNSQKRARLMNFSMALQNQIASAIQSADAPVITPVPVTPTTRQQINAAAAAHHMSPTAWMEQALAREAGGINKDLDFGINPDRGT